MRIQPTAILVVNEVDIDYSNYEYLNAQFHQRSGYCQKCGSFVAKPRSEHHWSGTATCTSGQTCTVCGGTSNPRGHAYESTVTIEPTCTTDGVRTYVCKNDSSHTYTEPIPATEHNYESSVTTEPTCTTDGVRTYVCKNDSSHTYTEPIPATEHNYESSVTTAATCTTDGVRTYVCKNDSSHTYTEPIPAAGHNLEKVEKKDAGCTKDGYEAYWRCQTCKKLFSDEAGTVEINQSDRDSKQQVIDLK